MIVLLASMTSIATTAAEPANSAIVRTAGAEANGTHKEIVLVVEEDGPAKYLPTGENGDYAEDSASAIEYIASGSLTITGPGKLSLYSESAFDIVSSGYAPSGVFIDSHCN